MLFISGTTHISPFSGEADLGGALQRAGVAHRQVDQLLHPCSRIVEEAQEDGIAPPAQVAQVRLVEDGGQDLRREVLHSRGARRWRGMARIR